MCGRFGLFTDVKSLAREFGAKPPEDFTPRYNIAPSQSVYVVRSNGEGGREIVPLRWGLIPYWAEDPKIGNRLINARAETAWQKPSFRNAFLRRRCLIPANGFYEWEKKGREKRPYYVRMKDGRTFAIAGLWDRWKRSEEEAIESCTILTTDSNGVVAPLHDRMPVLLHPLAYDLWLDPKIGDPAVLKPLLGPYPAKEMVAYPVDPRVNSPKYDFRELIGEAS